MSRNWKGLVGVLAVSFAVAVCSTGCGPEKTAIPSSFEAKPTVAPMAAGAGPVKPGKGGPAGAGGATTD